MKMIDIQKGKFLSVGKANIKENIGGVYSNKKKSIVDHSLKQIN